MLATRRTTIAALVSSIALLAACTDAPQPETAPADSAIEASASASAGASDWLQDVRAIARAGDNAGRRLAIKQQLDDMAIDWRSRSFAAEARRGENILAAVSGPADAPLLLLGAHSDRVDVGRGATDNASGSAAVLALAERFKQRPLQNHRVAVAFWDLEERGLLGAKAYIAAQIDNGGEKPALYVNFDVFGWGDTVWMMTADASAPLVAATRAATAAAGIGLNAGNQYPPTDHRAFLQAGWPAVSYSLIGEAEIPLILQAYAGQPPASPPKLMQVIHHQRDTLAEIDPDAAAVAIDAIERALRQWDATRATTAGQSSSTDRSKSAKP